MNGPTGTVGARSVSSTPSTKGSIAPKTVTGSSTSPSALESARSAVFGPAELLDGDLNAMYTRELLLASLVSAGWHDTIKHSTTLQQKLFLAHK